MVTVELADVDFCLKRIALGLEWGWIHSESGAWFVTLWVLVWRLDIESYPVKENGE